MQTASNGCLFEITNTDNFTLCFLFETSILVRFMVCCLFKITNAVSYAVLRLSEVILTTVCFTNI